MARREAAQSPATPRYTRWTTLCPGAPRRGRRDRGYMTGPRRTIVYPAVGAHGLSYEAPTRSQALGREAWQAAGRQAACPWLTASMTGCWASSWTGRARP